MSESIPRSNRDVVGRGRRRSGPQDRSPDRSTAAASSRTAASPSLRAASPPIPSDERYRDICATAARTFHVRGYDATTMNHIALAVGLTKPGLYHYVDSKEALFLDILTHSMDALDAEVVAKTIGIADPGRRFFEIVERHATVATCDDGIMTMLVDEVHALPPARRKIIDERRRGYFDYVRGTLKEMKRAGQLRSGVDETVATFTVLGMIVWVPHWFRASGRLSREAVAVNIVALARAGVLPYGPASSHQHAGEWPSRRTDKQLQARSISLDPRRFEICMAAARTIVERGYAATSMNEIADAAQLTKAALYHHFAGKEDLFGEIVRLGMDWLDEDVIKPTAATADPEDHLRQLIERHAALTACNEPWITELLDEMQGLRAPERQRIEQRKRAYFDLVRGRMRDLQTRGQLRRVDPTVATYSLLGMIIWIPRWFNPRGRLRSEEVAAQVADIALHGVARSAA